MRDGNFYSTEDVNIHYAEGPENGSTIIMLHGGGGTWESFMTIIPSLVERWHILALDFRGHGKSGRVASDYRIQSYTQDVVNFIQGKFDKAVILWGQSLGANIAIQVAAIQPKYVRALVVEEPAVDFSSEKELFKPLLQIFRNLARSGHSFEKIKEELAIIPVPIPGQDEPARLGDLRDEAYITFSAKCIYALDPEVMDFLIDGRAYKGYNVEEYFKQVVCPTLFLQGNPSLMGMTDEIAEYGVSLIPNCKHVYLENAGHNLHRTQPDLVVDMVENFLRLLV